jgi:hypothetical protein
MTNSNNQVKSLGASVAHSEGTHEDTFVLPDNFRQLAAMTAAATAKMEQLQTTRAQALRAKWLEEADALGMTPQEILTGTVGRKRGRKPRAKGDEQ